jgi:hypothetical protein
MEAAPDPSPASGAPRPPVAPKAAAREPGRLRINFEHPLKAGVLRVWLDGAPVINERIAGTVRKKGLVFKVAHGNFKDVLDVSPGYHKVRFRVTWDDNSKTGEIAGTFTPGETKTLEADLGRIRRDLDLAWK